MTNSLIPYSFVPGTKAMASEVNANFLALAGSVEEGRQYTDGAIENFNTEFESRLDEFSGIVDGKMEPDMSNSRNITNCLLEVPQRVKVQLNNGTLTLKASSVVIFPYGTANKTAEFPVGSTFLNNKYKVSSTQFTNGKFFVWAEVQSDVSATNGFSGSYTDIGVGISTNGNIEENRMSTTWTSGDTDSLTGIHYWYDTANNYLKKMNGTTITGYFSLPFCLMTNIGGSGFSSISQVFNGMGYIGSTVWVDKDVKGLSPNYRNSDDTLKNTTYTTPKIVLNNFSTTTATDSSVFLLINSTLSINSGWGEYNEAGNYWYNNLNNTNFGAIDIGKIWITNGAISKFIPNHPFRAIEISQVETLIKNFNTTSKGANGYIKLGDGVIIQWGKVNRNGSSYTVTLPIPFTTANYTPSVIDDTSGEKQSHASVTSVTTTHFGGGVSTDSSVIRWLAIGY